MTFILVSILFVSFGTMLYQDIKYRHIHISLPILVFAIATYMNRYQIEILDILKVVLFLGVNFLCITLYYSVKKSKLQNPFNSQIGIGDLLFLVGVVPLFSFRNYVLFFITGMIFTLLLFVVFSHRYTNEYIPLAGYLSLYCIILLLLNFFLPINIFYDFIV